MAISFNGTDENLILADDAALTLTPPLSVSFRFRITDPTISTWGAFVLWTSGTPYFYVIYYGTGSATKPGQYVVFYRDNSGQLVTGTSVHVIPSPTSWHTLIVTMSAGGNLMSYLDGDVETNNTNAAIGALDAAASLYFGSTGTPNHWLPGELAELAKWDREISSDERAGLVAGKSPIWYPDSLAWWLPGLSDAAEKIVPLSVTDNSGGLTTGPTIIYPPPNRTGIAWQLNPLGIGV